LYLWDNRPDSPTYSEKWVGRLGGANKCRVIVPPGIVHGYKNVSALPSLVFNAPNRLFMGEGRKEVPDEIRHEDNPASPFTFESTISKENANTLILTGAIRAVSGARIDPLERLVDQLCAIQRWLCLEELDRIIYVDTGGCCIPKTVVEDFSPYGDKYSCFSVDFSELARFHDIGRAEAEGINHVLEQMPEITHFYKCTGRYFIDNFRFLHGLVAECPGTGYVVRGVHDIPFASCDWLDTRLFYMTRNTWMDKIVPRISEIGSLRGGKTIEMLFYSCFEPNPSFTNTKPVITGHTGSCGWMWDGDYTPEEKQFAQDLIEKYGISTFIP